VASGSYKLIVGIRDANFDTSDKEQQTAYRTCNVAFDSKPVGGLNRTKQTSLRCWRSAYLSLIPFSLSQPPAISSW